MNARASNGHLAAAPRRAAGATPWRLGFWSLIATQFQGAFNDNALKFLVIYLIVDLGLPDKERDWLVLVVGALFALPFILFSMAGGYLADRFSKRSVTIGTKWMEVGGMAFALLALARGNLIMEAVGVFLLSSQGALFGPAKYGLLPEILPEKELSWGNGVIELGTFLAAITATVAAGYLAYYFRGRQVWSGCLLLACTFIGLAASHTITRVPAANPQRRFNLNPLGDLFEQIGRIRADRLLGWAVVGNTYLWFLAALLQFTIVIYGHDILRIDERHISYLQAAVAIGIGLGSLAAGYLSGGKIEYGLIPLGSAGMAVFGFLSAGHGLSMLRAAVYLGLLGFFGGFYAVPLNALIQHRPDPARKGGVIAAANLLSFVGVFLAAAVYFALAEGLHLGADQVFFVGACMTLLAALYAVVFLPDSLLRLGLWILTHTFYRVRVTGLEQVPPRGPALILAGRITLLDALLLTSALDRPVRFLSGSSEQRRPSLFQRMLHMTALPSSPSLQDTLVTALESGEVVCLAPRDLLPHLPGQKPSAADRARFLNSVSEKMAAPLLTAQLTGADDGVLRAQENGLALRRGGRIPCSVALRFWPGMVPETNGRAETPRKISSDI